MSYDPTTEPGRRRPTMMFEWDYGYQLPFRGWNNLEARLSARLTADLRSWLDEFEHTHPEQGLPDPAGWLAAGRRLRDRVAAEMGPDVDVFFPTVREEVIAVFQSWLTANGWVVRGVPEREVITAKRSDGSTLIAVVGEHSAPQRQSVDQLYGRLLRAMNPTLTGGHYAVVVPQSLISRCLEVPAEVRQQMGIDLYGVSEDGSVHLTGSGS